MRKLAKKTGVLSGLCVLLSVVAGGAQTLSFQLFQYKSGVAPEYFGQSVAGVGDLKGDGTADFAVGSSRANPNGLFEAGAVFVYSGATGALLYEIDGGSAGDRLGSAAAGVEDLDGDGTPDLIVGSPSADPNGESGAGKVGVYSGRGGNLLYEISGKSAFDHFGTSVCGVGDLDGDGRGDFIIGAPQTDPPGRPNAGSAYVYSGADSLLFQVDGALQSDFLGSAVAGAGDVNGDGKPDILIGAPFADTGPDASINAGAAFVVSGRDGSMIFTIRGDSADEDLGYAVAGAGDVNGDGRADFLIGAPNPVNPWDVGQVDLYSGMDGSLLHRFVGGQPGGLFGWSVAGAGDVNGDGKPDILIGAISTRADTLPYAGSAYLYSGADYSLLFQLNGAGAYDELGYSLSGAGDVNRDGRADLIIGALEADSGKGAVSVFGLVPTATPGGNDNRPIGFQLLQNYPNPFNPATTIRYTLSRRERAMLEIFNLAGQRVKILGGGEQAAGDHAVVWDGRDEKGKILSSGVYFYRLTGKDFSETKKMLLLK